LTAAATIPSTYILCSKGAKYSRGVAGKVSGSFPPAPDIVFPGTACFYTQSLTGQLPEYLAKFYTMDNYAAFDGVARERQGHKKLIPPGASQKTTGY
jgi:hypothetical protein